MKPEYKKGDASCLYGRKPATIFRHTLDNLKDFIYLHTLWRACPGQSVVDVLTWCAYFIYWFIPGRKRGRSLLHQMLFKYVKRRKWVQMRSFQSSDRVCPGDGGRDAAPCRSSHAYIVPLKEGNRLYSYNLSRIQAIPQTIQPTTSPC